MISDIFGQRQCLKISAYHSSFHQIRSLHHILNKPYFRTLNNPFKLPERYLVLSLNRHLQDCGGYNPCETLRFLGSSRQDFISGWAL